MIGDLRRETIENWVGDFCASDSLRRVGGSAAEFASEILTQFLVAACDVRDVPPDEIEEADVRAALLTHVVRLELPPSARGQAPALCAEFLGELESQGRLGGGAALGAFVRALGPSFESAASGKPAPHVRAGSKLGRNDPCPCGSGLKYKKCCMGRAPGG